MTTGGCRLVALACSVLGSVAARAQTVQGVTLARDARPLAGVVVLLLDGGSQAVGRALSSRDGEFRIVAAGAGNFQLRALRIGFRPTTSDLFALVLRQVAEGLDDFLSGAPSSGLSDHQLLAALDYQGIPP
ncbi:MAG TPA: carboxypeptidase-like regulatory domain-containing protein [Gemmatimonadaceae bacterium]|nr:carboxypeptidase-like regulatory domain-containing protein [Gemmatimonadaceae bacterium]